jgi:hypothetical protein
VCLGHCFIDAMHAQLGADEGDLSVLLSTQAITGPTVHLHSFLGSLQNAHDNSCDRKGWVDRMQELAHLYALSSAKLVELANPAWAAVDRW